MASSLAPALVLHSRHSQRSSPQLLQDTLGLSAGTQADVMLSIPEAEVVNAAGYRLVRPLRSGRSLLAVRESDACPVVVRRYGGDELPPRSIALDSSPHGMAILDVFSAGDTLLFIEEYAERGSLSSLRANSIWRAPHAVTALVPILEHIAARAELGWHWRPASETDLLVDRDGRVRFTSASQWIQQSDVEDWPAAVRDSQLGIRVLLGAIGSCIDGFAVELDRACGHGQIDGASLVHWLLRTQSAQALPEPGNGDFTMSALPLRIGSADSPHTPLPESTHTPVHKVVDTLRATLALVALGARVVRRRPVIYAAIGAALLTAGLLLIIPEDGSASESGAVDRASSSATAAASATVESIPQDPAEAALALLRLRANCADDRCLALVDDPSSALIGEDRAQLAAGLPLRANFAARTANVTSVLGDAVVLSVSGPTTTASVLLLQTEAGWRIRDVF